MTKLTICAGLLALLSCAACASTGDNIQRETARSIGTVAPEDVQVSAVQRGATNVKWEASTPQGRYACSADDMMRRTYCVKR